MTIAQILPRWLRRRPPPAAFRKTRPATKKDRQILPTLPFKTQPPARFQEDTSPPGVRIQWRG